MSKQIVVHNIDEQDKYKNTILDNLNNSVNMLQQVLRNSDALNAFKIFCGVFIQDISGTSLYC